MGQLFSKTSVPDETLHLSGSTEATDQCASVFDAIEEGRLEKLQQCIKEFPARLEAKKDGKSILHWTVLCTKPACVEFLINSGMDVNLRTKWGNTALMELAVSKIPVHTKWREVVELLIKANTNINATNVHKRTALLLSLIHFRHQISEVLLELGADPDIGDQDELRPIHVCATYAALPLLRKVLHSKADINAQDHKKRTALYFAILAGHTEIVNELLQHCADPNILSHYGCPLQIAIAKSKYEFVLTLIQHGASVTFPVSFESYDYRISKAKDYLNLALFLVHTELGVLQSVSATQTCQPSDRLVTSVRILQLIIQAFGNNVKVFKNVFFKSGKPKFIFSLPDGPLFRNLKQICRQLQFLHGMSHNLKSLPGEGHPSLESIADCGSLQNLCRMRVRNLVARGGTNVVYAVSRLDCTVVVKDLLILNDIF